MKHTQMHSILCLNSGEDIHSNDIDIVS